ncbi:MAG: site-2 protease family protein [Desulfobulbus sp.]|nr:MAG: site-2 protease family protein [Desulfobulbus sp.]RUM39693.1 MAG: site-2 protease family protein [Desulfobulbus sp.]
MDINSIVQQLVILAPPFLFALTFHELAHGYVAWRLGDPTAKDAGRLTMNPIKHLDPIGVIAFFIMKIGWAKPVPVNPNYFQNPRKGMLIVALAGPLANVLMAVISAVLVKLFLAFQVLPIFILKPMVGMLVASVWINIMLAVFNCLPIPPLDGSKVLMGVLPPDAARSYAQFERYGFIVLLALFYTGVIDKVIVPIISFANNLLLS